MKKIVSVLLMLLLVPALALADSAVLLLSLPEDAQMVENVEFDGGDFIQTYQLPEGAGVQLLRYSGFSMGLEELIASDWPLACHVQMHEDSSISGHPARSAQVFQLLDAGGYPVAAEGTEPKEGQQMLEIDLITVTVGNETLIFQGSCMSGQREEQILPIVESLQVMQGMPAAGDEQEADVG